MFVFLKNAWITDKQKFLQILILNIVSSIMASVGIVMFIPMLELLDINTGDNILLQTIFQPFILLSETQRLITIIIMYVLLLLIKALINRQLSMKMTDFIEMQGVQLRKDLYIAVSNADWENVSQLRKTDYIDLFTNQCGRFSSGVLEAINLTSSIFSALFQLVIACFMSLPLTFIVVVFGVLFLSVLYPFLKRTRQYGKKVIKINRSFFSELYEQLNSIKETRTYGIEKNNQQRFDNICTDFYDSHMEYTHLSVLPQMFYSVGAAVLIGFVFIISQVFLKVSTGQLIILVYIFSRLWPLFSSCQSKLQNLQSCIPAYDEIKKSMTKLTECSEKDEESMKMIDFKNNIVFKNVGFSYKDSQQHILDNISFDIEFGSVTALVGRSGAGKSTTADLMLGLLTPTSGEIMIDDEILDKSTLLSWRELVGYVPQEPLILNASIKENIVRFNPGVTDEEIIEALKKAQAWSFVEKLELGLETNLGDQGVRLSGGERQRIVLARVLVGNPKFIVLDEATSSLDYESEIVIRETINNLRGKVTFIIIAHRLATIKTADFAIVLQDGRLVENGKLDSLINKDNGYLSNMVIVE